MAGYTTYTWADVQERLLDRHERSPFYEDAEGLAAFNEALRVWNLFTGYWHERASLFTVAGQYLYTVPNSLLYRTRITWNSLPLSSSNREDLNNAEPAWRSETTATGGGVPSRPMIWAPVSLRSFYLWPADAVDNNFLLLDGVAATPILTTDGGSVDLGEELFGVLLDYALHTLLFKRGGPDFQDSMPAWQAFLAAAVEENSQLKTSNVFRRAMGLDDRGFKRFRGNPTRLDGIGEQQQ